VLVGILAVRYAEGAIAQLGERLNGIQEVGGSIPPGSTKLTVICSTLRRGEFLETPRDRNICSLTRPHRTRPHIAAATAK
jgi:hypothetical protein